MIFKIHIPHHNDVLEFAARELIRYGEKCAARFSLCGNLKDGDIILELFAAKDRWQDAYELKTVGARLHIRGSNSRSVLFGVYDYLRLHGFAFLYPGGEGEVVPAKVDFRIAGFDRVEKADRNYRGMAAFPEYGNWRQAEELIDWMAKNKLNIYFQEGFGVERPGDEYSICDGRHPLQHVEHAHAGKSWPERCDIARKNQRIVDEARKRGLLIERGGHGWNYGVPEHYAALKRLDMAKAHELLKARGNVNKQADVAVSTWFQLCLAKPEVREIYADHIAEYIERHQDEMDIAAVWVGDGYDNSCQCAECLKRPVSDFYLEIIRKVAGRIAETAPRIKLECIIYFETLEAPSKNYLEGLDNIILNFAAWRQCYIHRIDDPDCRFHGWEPDYRHNRSHDKERDLRILNHDQFQAYVNWRKVVGDAFDCYVFNYITLYRSPDRHFMSYNARNLVRDLKDFDKLHFSGMVPCQVNCNWDKPANLQLLTMSRMLWNKNDCDADRIRTEIFNLLYGNLSDKIQKYCDGVCALLTKCDYHHSLTFQNPALIAELHDGLQKYLTLFERLPVESDLLKKRLGYFSESLKSMIKITE